MQVWRYQMIISEYKKQLEIQVDSYEFPYDKKGKKEDNNWLNIKAIWEDEIVRIEGIVPCLTTMELMCLIEEMETFIQYQEDYYESHFLEPNLTIKLKKCDDAYAFYGSFLFKNENEPYILVKQMILDEVQEMIQEFKAMLEKFPIR